MSLRTTEGDEAERPEFGEDVFETGNPWFVDLEISGGGDAEFIVASI